MAPKVKDFDFNGGMLIDDGDATHRLTSAHDVTPWVQEWHWPRLILMTHLHSMVPFGIYMAFFSGKWPTVIYNLILAVMALLGVTAGAHRLFSHRSYKTKWPLRAILVFFNTLSLQNSAIAWARFHRLHHKYTETDADPHNANRGFFFSHIGWTLTKHHPEFEEKAKGVDLSDLHADPMLHFQDKYYLILAPLVGLFLPMAIPVYFWNEHWMTAYCVSAFRLAVTFHIIFLVNSAAHTWGNKPYDKNIRATESVLLSTFAIGEGFHNYHHTFPWDYKAAELGNNSLNFSTMFINFFAKIGWAYDLKTTSDDLIQKRLATTGDGSRHIWGWGDRNQTKDEVNAAIRINPKDD